MQFGLYRGNNNTTQQHLHIQYCMTLIIESQINKNLLYLDITLITTARYIYIDFWRCCFIPDGCKLTPLLRANTAQQKNRCLQMFLIWRCQNYIQKQNNYMKMVKILPHVITTFFPLTGTIHQFLNIIN